MRIVKVPLRISFFSAGTDMPDFYHLEKGAALNATIDKYLYVVTHETTDDEIHFSSPGEHQSTDDVTKMEHHITREILKKHGITKGLTISSISDIRCRGTGLGASSAYTVGLIKSLDAKFIKFYLPNLLAEAACEIEIKKCGYHIGKQDQYAAAFGGFNLFEFHPDGKVTQDRVKFEYLSQLSDSLILVDTGIPRQASTILAKTAEIIKDDLTKLEYTRDGRDLAYRGAKLLREHNFDAFGDLLNVSWLLKKSINNSTTNPLLDEIYEEAREAGAIGGKVLGAGGGGYMIFYVPPKYYQDVVEAMESMNLKVHNITFTNHGAREVYE